MREALTDFLQEVRRAGVPLSVAESMDALRAAASVLPERESLREAMAAAVVKDEGDRAIFDETFDRFFSAGSESVRHRARRAAARGEAAAGGGGGEGHGTGKAPRPREESRPSKATTRPKRAEERREGSRGVPGQTEHERCGPSERRRRRRELLRKPFRDMDPLEAEELSALAEDLSRRFRARLRRRLRYGRRGRLDFRRTLRRSIAHGGAAVDLVFRRRRPGRPDLVALCDVSGSVRHASDFFAAILGPCQDYFRRVRLFVFVDRLVEACIEEGRLVPVEPIDFHAFSDFGRVLTELEASPMAFGKSTVLLVLGDARNNRRPPRADALARLRPRVRTIWWLDPEAKSRWNQGDSVIAAYRPHCEVVLECATGAGLLAALSRLR
jgi:hypothetical protein